MAASTAGEIMRARRGDGDPDAHRSTAWTSARRARPRSRSSRRCATAASPVFVEARTYRFVGHSRSDPGRYRPEGELDRWRERDPLTLAAAWLARAPRGRRGAHRRGRRRGRSASWPRSRPPALAAPFPTPVALQRVQVVSGRLARATTRPLAGRRARPRRWRRRPSARSCASSASAIGMSLRELARRLDVSPSLVSQIETGQDPAIGPHALRDRQRARLSLDEIFELVGASGRRGAAARRRRGAAPSGADADAGVVHRARRAARDRARVGRALGAHGGLGRPRRRVHDRGLRRRRQLERRRQRSMQPQRPRVRDRAERHAARHGRLRRARARARRLDHLRLDDPHRLHNDGPAEVRAIWVMLGRYGVE